MALLVCYGLLGLAAVVLIVGMLLSPAATWPKAKYDERVNIGSRPYTAPGAIWMSRGDLAQRSHIGVLLGWVTVVCILAGLAYLGHLHG